jgi:hypothetical protein
MEFSEYLLIYTLVEAEMLTPAGYAIGTPIEAECRRVAAHGDSITQPHAVPSEIFYRRHNLPIHRGPESPVLTTHVPVTTAPVPAGPASLDSAETATAFTDVVEDLSERMNSVILTGDGRVLSVPYSRKTLTIDSAKVPKSSKYVSAVGIQMLNTLRYNDNAIATVNHIYAASFADREEANPVAFVCELWRAGWSDGEDKAFALFNTMKPVSVTSGSCARH